MTGIRVELELNDGSFTSGLLRAGQSLKSFRRELERTDAHYRNLMQSGGGYVVAANRIDNATRSLNGRMRDLTIITGGLTLAFAALTGASTGFIGSIVRVNSDMERLRFQMEGLSRAADPFADATQSVRNLQEMIREVPFSLNELSNSFVKMTAAGLEPASGQLQALADGIAAFGGTDEQLHRITLGITQMMGKSVIQMEELRQQLGESMPDAMRLMARSMGVSVAELADAIETGTVRARPALEAFFAEIERTYGGRAQRMMQTFSGQVTQMRANLQILATEEGSALKEFVTVTLKDLIQEFNSFLRSDAAERFAEGLGRAMTDVTNRIATVVRGLYQMRETLVNIGAAVAGFFALRAAIAGIDRLSTSLRALQLANTGLASRFTDVGAAMFNMQLRARSGAGAMVMLGGAARTAGMMARAAGAAFMTWAPWIAAVGSAVYIAADAMGVFKNETKEAYEELQTFGAESRAEAERIIEQRRAQLEANIAAAELSLGAGGVRSGGRENVRRRIAEMRAELEAIENERADIMRRAGEREDQLAAERLERQISDDIEAAQRVYRQRMDTAYEEHQEQLELMEETGRAKIAIDQEYQDEVLAAREERAEAELAILDRYLEEERQRYSELDPASTAAEASQGRIDYLMDRITEAQERLVMLANTAMGIEMFPDTEDSSDIVDRGTTALGNMREEIDELRGRLTRATGAYADMQRAIDRGDFGTIEAGGEAVAELHQNLRQAARELELLNELVEGREDAWDDLSRIEQDTIEQEIALRERQAGEQLTEAERFIERVNSGYYTMLGPTALIQNQLDGIVQRLDLQGQTLNAVADAMQDHAFGDTTVSRIDGVAAAAGRVNETLRGMAQLLAGLNFGNFDAGAFTAFGTGIIPSGRVGNYNAGAVSGTPPSQIGQRLMADLMDRYGLTREQAAGIVGNLAHESGNFTQLQELNPLVPGSRGGFGYAQWTGPRRRQFEAWAAANGLDPTSYEANAGFLFHELDNTGEGRVLDVIRRMSTADASAEAFSNVFLRPGIPHMQSRVALANRYAGMEPGADANMPSVFNTGTAPQPEPSDSAAYDPSITEDGMRRIVEQQAAVTEEIVSRAQELAERQIAAREGMNDAELQEAIDALGVELSDALSGVDRGQAEERVVGMIRDGRFGSDTDPESERYRRLVEHARELDRLERAREAREDAASDAESGMESLEREIRSLEEQSMTRQQIREREKQEILRQIDEIAQARIAAGEEEIRVAQWVEEQKARVRAAYDKTQNRFTQQMESWSNSFQNLDQKMGQWMNSMADGITGLIMGTGDLRSAIQGILSDLVNMGVKTILGNMFSGDKGAMAGGKGGGKGAARKGASAAMSVATKGKSGVFGLFHSGGIIGKSNTATRRASAGIFANAPRFHTGGIIGDDLKRNEVPIITKKGEGVFTKEQMAALAPVGSQGGNVTISAPVTVNAQGGSPEQNQDLARRVSKEMEHSMRQVVVQELQKQMRPGNMLHQQKRGSY